MVTEALGWGSLRIGRLGTSEDQLREFLYEEAASGSSFDVTACKNSLVAGVTASLVARGGSQIYTFQLRRPPTFGQGDLLPALEPSQYAYRDLSSSSLLVDAVQKVNQFRLDRRSFLVASLVLAVVFGVSTLALSDSVVFLHLTGMASFASMVSALTFFLRE
jgi:hypothetical protein